jgi:hypothetical protein
MQHNGLLFQLYVGVSEQKQFDAFQTGEFKPDSFAFGIAEVIIHTKYQLIEKGYRRTDYDVALVRLDYPVYDPESKMGVLQVIPHIICNKVMFNIQYLHCITHTPFGGK